MKRNTRPFLSALLSIFLLQVGFSQDPVNFIASTHTAENGDAVEVEISVTGFTDIISVQFTVDYDPAVLSFLSVGNFGLNYMANSNFGKPPDVPAGNVTFVWYDEALQGISVDDNTAIFTITFEVVGVSGDSTGIEFGDNPTTIEVTNAGGVMNPVFVPGYVNVTGPVSVQEIATEAFIFYPVYPNPVEDMAYIPFNLFEQEQVRFSVYDLSGRVVFEQTEVFLPGMHTIHIPNEKFPAAGTYFCRLEAGGHKGIQKILLVR
ncbi:MAG: T9SS type A sorting domain-containing protein [Saprospiraceae bacterium]|nr:T9SS type A sorting domain-containing protein [Saprospiraceae bacterium]